jgi:hypothetical protein
MLGTQRFAPVRFAIRQLGRGVFFGLLGLALTVATVSFLTACRCMEPFVGPPPDVRPAMDKSASPTPQTDAKTSGGN